jgi:ABC-type uncharacterized transport system auxiliary subunit
MRRRWLVGGMTATALSTALGGSGCSVLPGQPFLQRRDWPLVVRRPGELPEASPAELTGGAPGGVSGRSRGEPRVTLPSRPDGRVLLVRTVQAGPELATRGLQTLQQDGSLNTAFYEEWAVPPADGIDDDLRRWLADSGRFAAVLAPSSRMTADLVLEAELVAMHADLGSMTARAALALVLIDQRPSGARIRLQRTEAAAVKLEGTDPPAQVRAQLAAVAAVLRQTETALADAVRP